MMKLKVLMLLAAAVVLATSASAAVIGPWPSGTTYTWDTQPLAPYTSGSVSISGTPPTDLLLMPAPTGMSKTSWLPYGGSYAEKMAVAELVMNPGEQAASVHAKVYDPLSTGKSGWAVILKDTNGNILDFGIRGYFAAAQIIGHQYDGSAFTNGPASSRTRTGNNYYTMDFQLLPGGAIQYTIDAYENGSTWNYTNSTTVTYANISEIYLSTATPDTSGAANYKWTEFSYAPVPEPASLVALATGLVGMAGFAIRRKRS